MKSKDHGCNQNQVVLSKENDEMKMYAFDAGQAYFTVTQKGDTLVIIDAKKYEYQMCLCASSFQAEESFADFITHPHEDHFDLFVKPDPLK